METKFQQTNVNNNNNVNRFSDDGSAYFNCVTSVRIEEKNLTIYTYSHGSSAFKRKERRGWDRG